MGRVDVAGRQRVADVCSILDRRGTEGYEGEEGQEEDGEFGNSRAVTFECDISHLLDCNSIYKTFRRCAEKERDD